MMRGVSFALAVFETGSIAAADVKISPVNSKTSLAEILEDAGIDKGTVLRRTQ